MAAQLRETAIAGERVLALEGRVLVASKSAPGVWHVVADGACTCAGYQYRHTCRHLAVAVELLTGEKLIAPPPPAPPRPAPRPPPQAPRSHGAPPKPNGGRPPSVCPSCHEPRRQLDLITGVCALCLISLEE